jgi:protein phosphatase
LLAAPPVFAVADGVGGHAAGEVASGLAVSGLERFSGGKAVEAASLLTAVTDVNGEIRARGANRTSEHGMGSTVVGLALSWNGDDDALLVFNVGDSRAFRLHGGQLEQVSRDHSLVDELVRGGHITAAEAEDHPCKSVITRALGAADDLEIDSWLLEPVPGDRFLLCSDGLTNEVSAEDVAAVLRAESDPQAAAERLVELALDGGGRDNVSVVVVDVDSVQAAADQADGGSDTLVTEPIVVGRPDATLDDRPTSPGFEPLPDQGPRGDEAIEPRPI